MGVLEELLGTVDGGHEHGPIGHGQCVDRLKPVPGPGFHALEQGVVDAYGDVHFLGLVAGHVLFELFRGVGHDGKVLGRDTVPLGTVPVAPECDAPLPGLAGREHDPAHNPSSQVFLENTPVHHFTDEVCHVTPLPRSTSRGSRSGLLVRWSDHYHAPGAGALSSIISGSTAHISPPTESPRRRGEAPALVAGDASPACPPPFRHPSRSRATPQTAELNLTTFL